MKKIRKVLIAVFSVMLLVCMGLFAACDNGNSNSNDNGGTSGNEQTETTYTVTYALGDHAAAGATAPAAATATEAGGYKVTLPAAPAAATGWKFVGWKVGSDVKQVGDEITVSADVTVTAQWVAEGSSAATYTVTYALGDHAATDAQVPPAATATETGGYKVTLPAAVAAAEGWKFNGWKVGNDVKAAGSEITVSANMTVTADWAEVVYTVTYTLGDHAADDATVPPAATANLANSYKVTLPDAPKAATYWEFAGWKVGDDTEVKEVGAELTVSADVTVTATWVEATYTVTYTLGDHAADDATVPEQATANSANSYKVTLPDAPDASEGWEFSGWKVGDDTELKAAGAELPVSANVTVTAQWEEITYTVTFALGDHAAEDATVPTAATANHANSYKVTLPDALNAADDWRFAGWKVGYDIKAAGSEITVSENLTVTAIWSAVLPATYNGTWQQKSSDTVSSGDLIIAADGVSFQNKTVALVPTTSGYSFTYTDDDGDSVAYSIDLPTDLDSKVLVLTHTEGIVGENEEDVVVYLLKVDDTYPAVSFGTDLVGDWNATGSTSPSIAIRADGLSVGATTATVLVSNASSRTYMVYADGSVYKLTYASGLLKLLVYGEAESKAVTYTKYVEKEAVLPDDLKGTWKNDAHTVVIDKDGKFTFDGEEYKVYVFSGSQYTFTDKNSKKWVFYKVSGGLYFQQGYDDYFTLKSDENDWDWGVQFPTIYTGTYSGSGYTLVIYQDGKLSWGGKRVTVVDYNFKTYAVSEFNYAQFTIENGGRWQFNNISAKWSESDKQMPIMNPNTGRSYTLTYTGPAPATWGAELESVSMSEAPVQIKNVQSDLFVDTSATQLNQEPTVVFESIGKNVLLLDDLHKYLGTKGVTIKKQVSRIL